LKKRQQPAPLQGEEEESCLTPWNHCHSATISTANNSKTTVWKKNQRSKVKKTRGRS
jgi:hypothetical protein